MNKINKQKRTNSNNGDTLSVSHLFWISLAIMIALGTGFLIYNSLVTRTSAELDANINPNESNIYTPIVPSDSYIVLFDTGGGIPRPESQFVFKGGLARTPSSPAKQGYTFAGWSPSVEGTVINANTTFTAIWVPNEITISFNLDGGIGYAPTQIIKAGDTILKPDNPTREDFTFVGWSPGIPKSANKDTVFKAVWMPNGHLVTFNVEPSTTYVASQSVEHGGYATKPYITPVRLGYEFKGWSPNIERTIITQDTIFTAIWETRKYIVQFNTKGGYPVPNVQYVEFNQYAEVPNFEIAKFGSIFDGWDRDIASTKITQDTTFNIKWIAPFYTVSFNTTGGRPIPPDQVVERGELATSPSTTPTKADFIFAGWSPNINSTPIYEDLEFVAKWEKNTFSVYFNTDGGTPQPPKQEVAFGEKVVKPSTNPTKVGHVFMGWAPDLDEFVVEGYLGEPWNNEDDGITIKALWKPLRYTIVFDPNGGEGIPAPIEREHGLDPVRLPATTPTKTGYRFSGWTENPSGTGTVYQPGSFYYNNASVTLYAKWLPIEYYINYKANGGSGTMVRQKFLYNQSANMTTNAYTRSGYDFVNWKREGDNATFSDKATVYNWTTEHNKEYNLLAQWTPNNYTISFDSNGGSDPTPSSKTVAYGSSYGTLPTVTRAGYTFQGWFTLIVGGNQVVSTTTMTTATNHTLFARWTANTYTVTFNANGGTPTTTTKSVQYDSPYGTLASVSRTGYTFDGWYTEEFSGTKILDTTIYKVVGNQILYAHWNVIYYTVTFNSAGGSSVPSQYIAYNNKATVPTPPTKTGYTFDDWVPSIAETVITKNTVFTARWTANKYTVTFNSNGGGTPSPTSKQVTYGETYGTLATVSRTGYNFNGWYTSSSGGTKIATTTSYTTVGDRTLYAQWSIKTYTITYDKVGGTGGPSNAVKNHGATYTIPNTRPTKTSNVFKGWKGSNNITYAPGISYSYSTDANLTLTAIWEFTGGMQE